MEGGKTDSRLDVCSGQLLVYQHWRVKCNGGSIGRINKRGREQQLSGMWKQWDVEAVGCGSSGMGKQWDVEAVRCGSRMWRRKQRHIYVPGGKLKK
jgi:hypothetical protein